MILQTAHRHVQSDGRLSQSPSLGSLYGQICWLNAQLAACDLIALRLVGCAYGPSLQMMRLSLQSAAMPLQSRNSNSLQLDCSARSIPFEQGSQ